MAGKKGIAGKYIRTEEIRKKMSLALKGRTSWNKGLKMPEEVNRKNSEVQKRNGKNKGEKNPNWKGGISSLNHLIRTSPEMKLWRKSVFERDNYSCIWCGISGSKSVLHADHIKPFAIYPELRFAIDNGRTLCKPCHKTTDTFAKRFDRHG